MSFAASGDPGPNEGVTVTANSYSFAFYIDTLNLAGICLPFIFKHEQAIHWPFKEKLK